MTRLVSLCVTIGCCCLVLQSYEAGSLLHVQTTGTNKPRLAFEAAVIRPSPATSGSGIHVQVALCRGIDTLLPTALPVAPPPLGYCRFRLWSIRDMVGSAYLESTALIDQFVTGGPSWFSADTFDFDGKAEDPAITTEADLKAMLRSYLEETLKLKFHTVPKQFVRLVLLATKSTGELRIADSNSLRSFQVDANGNLKAENESMADLARWIGQRLRRPVIDRTNLAGRYTFTLQNAVGPDGSIFQGIDRFGLRLEEQRVVLDSIVIDHIEKPQP